MKLRKWEVEKIEGGGKGVPLGRMITEEDALIAKYTEFKISDEVWTTGWDRGGCCRE